MSIRLILAYIGVIVVARFLTTSGRPRRTVGDFIRAFLDPTFHLLSISSLAAVTAPLAEYFIFRRPPPLALNLVGATLALCSGIVAFEANRALGRAFTPYVDRGASTKGIVEIGLYRFIRHPLYTAGFLLTVGAPLMLACRFSWIFSLACWIAIFFRTVREENLLKRNMAGYDEYMERTKRFVPWLL